MLFVMWYDLLRKKCLGCEFVFVWVFWNLSKWRSWWKLVLIVIIIMLIFLKFIMIRFV